VGSYLAVLAAIVVGSGWLELVVRTRVLRRWRRLLLSIAPVVALFAVWDLYAIAEGHWTFDPDRIVGLKLPGGMPVEELLFFVVVPFASVLTFEAVRSVRGWSVPDGATDVGPDR